MDGDYPRYDKKTDIIEKGEDPDSSISDLFQPSWIRCPFSSSDDLDRILLDYGCNFLWRIGVFLWVVFLACQTW